MATLGQNFLANLPHIMSVFRRRMLFGARVELYILHFGYESRVLKPECIMLRLNNGVNVFWCTMATPTSAWVRSRWRC